MPFGFGNAYDITSTGMHYADPKTELVHKSWNSETLPIVSKRKWKSFAFPLPHSYILRLEQLFPSTIYIIGHGCCAVVGESAVCRYYIYMAFLWQDTTSQHELNRCCAVVGDGESAVFQVLHTWHFFEDTTYTTWTQPVTSHQSNTSHHHTSHLSLFRRRFLGARNCITASTSTHGYTRWCREYIQSTSSKSRSLPSHGRPRPFLEVAGDHNAIFEGGYVTLKFCWNDH